MKKKNPLILVTVVFFGAVIIFFIAGFKKSPYSTASSAQTSSASATELISAVTANAKNTVTKLSPSVLKGGTAVFTQFSVSELNQQFVQKKEILNTANLSPTVTNHPVLDGLIEQKFKKALSELPDTFSKAKYCYDWLINNTQFGGSTVNMQNMYAFLGDCNYGGTDGTVVYDAYRILLTGQGVCDNYASALTVLYRYIGLDAYIVHGKAILADDSYTNHIWVAVNIQNTVYWFDPQIESAAAEESSCVYALFCFLPDTIPFYTHYNITESRNAYRDFRLQSPLQVECAVNGISAKAFTYRPGDVNEYGDVVIQSAVQTTDLPREEIPIALTINGGTPPYQCTVQTEYLQNGKRITDSVLPAKTVSDAVTVTCLLPSGAQLCRVTVRIRDSADRNMVCVTYTQ